MIRVSQLKLPVEHNEEQFCQKIEKSLKIKKDQIKKLQIVKKSIDARKKPDVSIVYSVDVWVDNEEKILKHSGNKNAVCVKEKKYKVPEHGTERSSATFLRQRPRPRSGQQRLPPVRWTARKFMRWRARSRWKKALTRRLRSMRMCAKSSLTPVCPQNRSRSSTTPIRRSKSGNCSQKSGVVRCAS